jgi:hypothetical protein
MSPPSSLHTQRFARTWIIHLPITAKRHHRPINTGQPILRGAEGKLTAPNHFAQLPRIVGQYLPINPSRIIDDGALFGTAPFEECLPPFTVRLDRAVVAAAEHVFRRLRPWIAQLPAVAELRPSRLPTNAIPHTSSSALHSSSHVIPPRMLSVIRDQGPCDLWGMSSNAGLAALYDQEQGHLMIWPPEHRYRWAGGGSAG